MNYNDLQKMDVSNIHIDESETNRSGKVSLHCDPTAISIVSAIKEDIIF